MKTKRIITNVFIGLSCLNFCFCKSKNPSRIIKIDPSISPISKLEKQLPNDSFILRDLQNFLAKDNFGFKLRGKEIDCNLIAEKYLSLWYCEFLWGKDSVSFKKFLNQGIKTEYYASIYYKGKCTNRLNILIMDSKDHAVQLYSNFVMNALDGCQEKEDLVHTMILKDNCIFILFAGDNNKLTKKQYSASKTIYHNSDNVIMDSIRAKRLKMHISEAMNQ